LARSYFITVLGAIVFVSGVFFVPPTKEIMIGVGLIAMAAGAVMRARAKRDRKRMDELSR
jgi:hypothetical protein